MLLSSKEIKNEHGDNNLPLFDDDNNIQALSVNPTIRSHDEAIRLSKPHERIPILEFLRFQYSKRILNRLQGHTSEIEDDRQTMHSYMQCNINMQTHHTPLKGKHATNILYSPASCFSPFDIIKKKGGQRLQDRTPTSSQPLQRDSFTAEEERDGKIVVGSKYPRAQQIESLVGP